MSDWDTPPTDAELAQGAPAPASDWDHPPTDAELAGHAAEKPGLGEAVLRAGGQGFAYGHGDELAAAGSAALDRILPESLGGKSAEELARPGHNFSDDYVRYRDQNRREDKAADEAHPTATMITKGLTSLPAAIATGGGLGAGSGVATTALAGAATGALQGGVQGLGESEGGSVNGVLKDGRNGALVGGAMGGAMPLALSGLKAGSMGALQKVAPGLAESAQKWARVYGRKAIAGGAQKLAVPKSLSDEVVDNALANKVVNYGNGVGGIAEKAAERAKVLGTDLGAIKDRLAAGGITGPDAAALANQLEQEGAKLAENSATPYAANEYKIVAKHLRNLAATPKVIDNEGMLGLRQAESIKTNAQDAAEAEFRKVNGSSPVGEAKKAVSRQIREANENAIESQLAEGAHTPELQQAGADFVPAKKAFGMNEAVQDIAAPAAERAKQNGIVPLKALVASGGWSSPGKLAASVLLQRRGNATAAAAARDLSKGLGKIGRLAAQGSPRLGKFLRPLSAAAARGGSSLAVTQFILSSDPHYQELKKQLDDEPDQED